jgi:hypothetical protein
MKERVMQASYFVGMTLPLAMAPLDTCVRRGREIVEMPNKAFRNDPMLPWRPSLRAVALG